MSNPYILSSRSKSATLLGTMLKERTGVPIEVASQPRTYSPIIRWGRSHGQFSQETSLNFRDLIKLGKRTTFSDFLVKKEIRTIRFYKKQPSPEDFPMFVRKRLTSSEGRGIVYLKSIDEWSSSYLPYFWSPEIKFDAEFGVHLLGGEKTKIFKKIPQDGSPIKNSYNCTFSLRSSLPVLEDWIKNIYKIYPIQFARFDVGYKDGSYYMIEVNTCPSLTGNSKTAEMYADFLAERLAEGI